MNDFEYIDAVLENADWTKQSWDLPPYKSKEFMAFGFDLDKFKALPVYAHAVRTGLIVEDTWVTKVYQAGADLMQKYSEDQPRDERGRFGSGGGTSADAKTGAGVFDKYESVGSLQAACDKVAQDLNYTGKITATDGEYKFTLNGKNYSAGGTYTPFNNEIKMYRGQINKIGMAPLLAHEIQHAKFDFATRTGPDAVTADIKSYIHTNLAELAKTDGVTSYSRAYWEQAAKNGSGRWNAVNETLSEMAKNSMKTNMTAPHTFGHDNSAHANNGNAHPTWQKLYDKINSHYAAHNAPKTEAPKVAPPPKVEAVKPPAVKLTPEQRKEKRLEYRRNRLKNMNPEQKQKRSERRKKLRIEREQKKQVKT